ncbi:MAG: hypothetical protein H7Y18_13695 [Clostridiaceae bacterium]|nr:hypothetical protein [Clostridiaceae bacterium]
MSKIENAIERIKMLECPTGQVENRITGILEDYGVANRSEVEVKRYEELNINGAEGFCAKISGDKNQTIIVLANSGMDDYVAKVMDAYLK